MRRLLFLLIVAFTLVSPLLTFALVVKAQSGWSIDVDFHDDRHGVEILTVPGEECAGPFGEYLVGQGFSGSTLHTGCIFGPSSSPWRYAIYATKDHFFSTPARVTKIQVTFSVLKIENDICGEAHIAIYMTDNPPTTGTGTQLTGCGSIPDGDNQTADWTGDISGMTDLWFDAQIGRSSTSAAALDGSKLIIHSIHFEGLDTAPLLNPGDPAGCIFLSANNANFIDPNDWDFVNGAVYQDTDEKRGLHLVPNSLASMPITLSTSRKYAWQVIYEGAASSGNGNFTVNINGQPFSVPVQDDMNQHLYSHPEVQFETKVQAVKIERPTDAPNDLAVMYFCIMPGSQVGGGGDDPGGQVDGCQVCDPPLGITDIIGILNWIICNIRRLFTCYLIPTLRNFLTFLVTGVKYLLSFITWILSLAKGAVDWVAGLVSGGWQLISGFVSNLFTGLGNAFHTSGAANDLNIMMSTARDLPTMIENGVASFAGQLGVIFATSTNLIELIIRLIGLAASAVAYVLGLIPLVISSLIAGINATSTPVSGSPVCSDPTNALYFPCLGFYILDNTLFSGPAGYLIPILIGVLVLETLTWAFTRIKEELTK